jgi:hypothetical protein
LNDLRLKPQQLAGRIRMERNANTNITILLVEGPSDQKFWRGFVLSTQCKIWVAGDRDNLLKIVESVTGGAGNAPPVPGILGIIDDDHDSLLNRQVDQGPIVRTDGTDLEAMLAWGPPLLRVLDLHADFARLENLGSTGADVQAALFTLAGWWGKIRAFDRKRGRTLNFTKDFAIHRFLDEGTLELNVQGLLHQACQLGLAENPETLGVELANFDAHPPNYVAQGHDLIRILSIGLKKVWGNNNKGEVGETQLANSLFASTHPGFLSTTRTFVDIQQWETKNKPYLALKVKTQPELDTTLA